MRTMTGAFEGLREVWTRGADRLSVESGFVKRWCKMSGALRAPTMRVSRGCLAPRRAAAVLPAQADSRPQGC